MRIMDPFADFDRLVGRLGESWRPGVMPMDAFERDGVYTMRFDLPGVDPDHVDVTVEGNVLTVTADRKEEDTAAATWLLRERPTGSHRRQVRLGNSLDASGVTADYDQGVLTVTVPTKDEAKPQRIAIGTAAIASSES